MIDDDGNLFGVVNVVDALVVLLVLAVVAAGVALVNPFATPSEDVTRYATMDLGEQRPYVAELISEGDVLSPADSGSNVTVTDVYVTPGSGENVSITARVELEGSLVESDRNDESVFAVAGKMVRRGTTLNLETDEYGVTATVLSFGESNPSLETSESAVTVSGSVSAATAESISQGDTYEVGERTVATIDDLHIAPGEGPNSRMVTYGLTLQTIGQSGSSFAGEPVTVGQGVTFQDEDYSLEGEIEQIGSSAVRTSQESVTLRTTVSAETAESIDAGDTYRFGGTPIAEVTTVRTYPSSGDGQRTVFLGLELTTVSRSGAQMFGGTPVAIGSSLTFDSEDYSLSGQVQELGSNAVQTGSTDVVVTSTVRVETADVIEVGDSYRVGGSDIATVESVSVYPSSTDGKRNVVLGVSLETIDRSDGRYFGDRLVRVGTTLPFQTDTYALSGTVVTTGSLSQSGDTAIRTVELQLESVPPKLADGIDVGMTERSDGAVSAHVTAVEVEPAVIALTSDDGNIYEREHPVRKDVYVTVEVTARQTPSGLFFHGSTLQEGDTMLLDLGTISVQGAVTELEATSKPTNATVPVA